MNLYHRSASPRTLAVVIGVFAITVFASPSEIRGQAAPAAAASPSPAAVAAAPAAAASTAPSASGIAIESTLLQYQGAAETAFLIAGSIQNAIQFQQNAPARVIIATNADIAAIVQLRAVLGQAALIGNRLDGLTQSILKKTAFPCWSTIPTKKPPSAHAAAHDLIEADAAVGAGLLGGLIQSPADLQTLVQTIASIGAVTESASPAAGTLADTSLINLVAGDLPKGTAYVPSMYPPALLRDRMANTLLGTALTSMDDKRVALYAAADRRLLVPACQSVTNKPTVAQLTAEVTAANNLVESFEVSLFTGQSFTPPATSTVLASTAASASAPASATTTTTSTPAAAQTTATSTGSIIQLLYADSILKAVENHAASHYYMASVHALESGGNTITRTNLFLGSRTYYSGGAAATFSVFGEDGRLVCSGVGYGYRGFVQAKDVGIAALKTFIQPTRAPQAAATAADDAGEVLPPVARFSSSCSSIAPPAD